VQKIITPQSVRLALETLAVMQQIRSLLREKRTFLPALKMTLLTQSDSSRLPITALRKAMTVRS
jgi:hypothetical protein